MAATSPGATTGLPQDDHARPTHSTFQLDCAHQIAKSMFVQLKTIAPSDPKLFVLSLMVKMLLPVACQLAYSWTPLPCNMIYMYLRGISIYYYYTVYWHSGLLSDDCYTKCNSSMVHIIYNVHTCTAY